MRENDSRSVISVMLSVFSLIHWLTLYNSRYQSFIIKFICNICPIITLSKKRYNQFNDILLKRYCSGNCWSYKPLKNTLILHHQQYKCVAWRSVQSAVLILKWCCTSELWWCYSVVSHIQQHHLRDSIELLHDTAHFIKIHI